MKSQDKIDILPEAQYLLNHSIEPVEISKNLFLKNGKADWIDEINSVRNNKNFSSTILASSRIIEGFLYTNLLDEKLKTKFEIADLVRAADKKDIFSKGDTTNWSWSYKLYTFTEIIIDTISTYHVSNLPQRSKDA